MNDFKAIETNYKGYKFRSRTEARWAIFFDACGIEWKYEHEGYELGDLGFYLPDFWLPEAKTFAEVKGQEFSVKESNLCRRLALKSGHPVVMLAGAPEVQEYRIEMPNGLLEERVFLPKDRDRVVEAVTQARSARFEHGETPVDVTPRAQLHVRQRRRTERSERGSSAERELIRAILLDRSRLETIAEKLTSETFRNPAYRSIYVTLTMLGADATLQEIATDLAGYTDAMPVRVLEDIVAEGLGSVDTDRTIKDSIATIRARELDHRAADLDRLIPLAVSGPEKDKLIQEKEAIRKELIGTARKYFKQMRPGVS